MQLQLMVVQWEQVSAVFEGGMGTEDVYASLGLPHTFPSAHKARSWE